MPRMSSGKKTVASSYLQVLKWESSARHSNDSRLSNRQANVSSWLGIMPICV